MECNRLEGRGDHQGLPCGRCGVSDPGYRCRDCDGCELFCQACIVASHSINFLHRIQVRSNFFLNSLRRFTDFLVQKWNGTFFENTSLKDLGLHKQLNHRDGQICLNFDQHDDFVILSNHGIHEVSIRFCACESALHPVKQLLRHRLWPATTTNPKTAATFNCLERFQLESFEGKLTVFEYYHSLLRGTDNTGVRPPRVSLLSFLVRRVLLMVIMNLQDRYEALLRMVLEWRHMRMLKRSGRGHHPDGVNGTQEGQLAVLCPACPQPDINLPSGWELAPAEKQYADSLPTLLFVRGN